MRCLRYHFAKLVHTLQSQSESRGSLSNSNFLLVIFILPVCVKATQCLPRRVGSTQSNISIHLSIASIRSSGVPTHIRYLGLFSGSFVFKTSNILYISFLLSPTDKPQIATQ
jgi:hypothetical protein